MTDTPSNPTPIAFKAEIRQVLDILIHSLYTDREIFSLRKAGKQRSIAKLALDFVGGRSLTVGGVGHLR